MKYIPKRLLTLVVGDDDVDRVVQEIIKINQTAQIGDGKIFVCPVDNVVRVRTDECGEEAPSEGKGTRGDRLCHTMSSNVASVFPNGRSTRSSRGPARI